jgi:hypothetical protein
VSCPPVVCRTRGPRALRGVLACTRSLLRLLDVQGFIVHGTL